MSDELEPLPEGWALGTIDDSGEYINGFAFKPQHRSETGLPIIRIQNLTNENKPIHLTDIKVDQIYKVVDGDILVSWSATLDTFIWRRGPALVNQHIFKVVPETKLIEKKLLFYWLKIAIEDLQKTEHLHGSTMKHINRGPFMAHKLQFPPKNEQTRIVEKLEELLSDLDNGVAELKAAQTKLTQYRQSLLKSAVEGSLTAEWRKQNPIAETGEQLLQRILTERRQRWEQQKLVEFEEKGRTPPKDWQKKYPEPVKPNTSELPGLPEGWVWASVDQLVLESSYGTSVKCDYVSKNTAVLRIPNVAKKKLDISDLKFSTQDLGLSDDKYLKDGDILIVRTNGSISLVGQTALFRGEFDKKFYFASYLLRLRPILTNTLSEWMDSFFGSMPARKWIEENASSSAGQNNISLSTFSTLAVPLPPLVEQKILIRQLGSGFENCNTQLSNNEYGLQQAEAQRKNILKDAFSGKLVPQEPSDEPASVLLEKIRAERLAQAKLPKPKRIKKKANNKASIMDTLFEVLKAKGDWMDAQEAFRACGVTDGGDFSDIVDKVESLYAELRKLEKEEQLIEIRRVGNYDQLKLRNGNVS